MVPSLWSGGLALLNVLSLFVITPFVAYYLLRDWDKMVARLDDLLPRDHADAIRFLVGQMDHKVAAFVRGQMLSGLILGIFYASGLFLVGLNYSLSDRHYRRLHQLHPLRRLCRRLRGLHYRRHHPIPARTGSGSGRW